MNNRVSAEQVKLASQQMLTSLHAAVHAALSRGVQYGEIMLVGGWELKFGHGARQCVADFDSCDARLAGLKESLMSTLINRSNAELLRVTAVKSFSSWVCRLEFDDYVPLRWSTSNEALGCGVVRFGNYRTTLFELLVEPYSQLVRDATLTSLDTLSTWPQIGSTRGGMGVPVLSTRFESWQRLDLELEFFVALRDGEIVIFWDDLESCIAHECDRVRFLVSGDKLAGMLFTQLTKAEIDTFSAHVPGGK